MFFLFKHKISKSQTRKYFQSFDSFDFLKFNLHFSKNKFSIPYSFSTQQFLNCINHLLNFHHSFVNSVHFNENLEFKAFFK